MTLNDLEAWTHEIVDFSDFLRSSAAEEWIATKWIDIDQDYASRNCYGLSRVSWALAQFFCCLQGRDPYETNWQTDGQADRRT